MLDALNQVKITRHFDNLSYSIHFPCPCDDFFPHLAKYKYIEYLKKHKLICVKTAAKSFELKKWQCQWLGLEEDSVDEMNASKGYMYINFASLRIFV